MCAVAQRTTTLRKEAVGRFYIATSFDENETATLKKGKMIMRKFGKGLVPRTKRFKHVDGHIVFVRHKERLEKENLAEKSGQESQNFKQTTHEARSSGFQPS